MIYDDYEQYVKKYKGEYGDNTIVLLECGSFYEIYDDGNGLNNMKDLSDLLNIQVSRRNKSIVEVSRNNFEMAGFPSHALRKFINILVGNNYTVVIVSQVTPPPNPKRAVTEIVSPGTYIDTINGYEGNNLMCVYFEESTKFKSDDRTLSLGISIIDLSTGVSYVCERSSKSKDEMYPLDELFRLSSVYNPKEIVIFGEGSNVYNINKFKDYIDGYDKYIHDQISKYDRNILKPYIQDEIIRKCFDAKLGFLKPVEFLDMERKSYAMTSYVKLLQFVFNHNEKIIDNITKPCHLEDDNHLVLSYNTAKQLDVISCNGSLGKYTCLLNILNNCKTSIGKRYFKKRLLHPYNDASLINESYGYIEHWVNHFDTLINVRSYLTDTYDIERLFRKANVLKLSPCELYNIVKTVRVVREITKYDQLSGSQDISSMCDDIVSFIEATFDEESLIMFNLENIGPTVFKKGTNVAIDDLQSQYDNHLEFFKGVANKFSKDLFKIESNEKDGYYLVSTMKRYNEAKSIMTKSIDVMGDTLKSSDFYTKSVATSNVKIFHPMFEHHSNELERLAVKIKKICINEFTAFLKTFTTKFITSFSKIKEFIERIDYITTCGYNAYELKHCKPAIINKYNGKSYIDVKQLRHPLVETLQKDMEYIANDIQLGIPEQDGILLYGINSSGKSSLMKSIGIAVIMAQAGMYVPAECLEFFPYDRMFTRIFSNDDIFKGQSTFTKEILELRNILRRANTNSLIIGDELCSGTESISALSIVSAGVITLSLQKSSFIFATHLHDLIDVQRIKDLQNIGVYHLDVKYDESKKCLIYDRKLKAGNGSSLYGIEVCKSLDLEEDFLKLANTIRQEYIGVAKDIIDTSQSCRYNKLVVKDLCKVCTTNPASEVHHIKEQHTADERGFIGKHHKNSLFNLVPLCSECHDKVHKKELEIHGYATTSFGRQLVYDDIPPATHGDSIKEIIRVCIGNNMKIKDIETHVKTVFPSFSMYKIKKHITSTRRDMLVL